MESNALRAKIHQLTKGQKDKHTIVKFSRHKLLMSLVTSKKNDRETEKEKKARIQTNITSQKPYSELSFITNDAVS